MDYPRPDPAGTTVLARDRLANGVLVSTVRLPGPRQHFETTAFSAGWPERPDADELDACRATQRVAALANHARFVERYRPRPDPDDPDWVFRLLGLPPRREDTS